MQGFPVLPNQLSEMQFVLYNPVTFSDTETLESLDLLPLYVDDRKVFTAKAKANNVDF